MDAGGNWRLCGRAEPCVADVAVGALESAVGAASTELDASAKRGTPPNRAALVRALARARGAADALWLHADLASWAPLAWIAAAGVLLATTFHRMRIA